MMASRLLAAFLLLTVILILPAAVAILMQLLIIMVLVIWAAALVALAEKAVTAEAVISKEIEIVLTLLMDPVKQTVQQQVKQLVIRLKVQMETQVRMEIQMQMKVPEALAAKAVEVEEAAMALEIQVLTMKVVMQHRIWVTCSCLPMKVEIL